MGSVSIESPNVRLWDLDQLSRGVEVSLPHPQIASAVAFSNDGVTIASASQCAIFLWNYATVQQAAKDLLVPQCQATIEAHSSQISTLQFRPGNHELVSAGHDGMVRLWSVDPASIEAGWSRNRLAVLLSDVYQRMLRFSAESELGEGANFDMAKAIEVCGHKFDCETMRTVHMPVLMEWAQTTVTSLQESGLQDAILTSSYHNAHVEAGVVAILRNEAKQVMKTQYHGHVGIVVGASASPNSEFLISASESVVMRIKL